MNIEVSADTRHRAALHAVLSDPARLAVVDLLACSDASPSELGHRLGMASNLVAHHIGVLVEHGFVRRTPSEGDRRRTYLSLVPGALDRIGRAGGPVSPAPARVVFVCTANSARSQLAAAVWQRMSRLPAASAGTHPARDVAPGAVRTARRHRLPPLVQPRALDDVLAEGDVVVTVCDRAHEETPGLAAWHWSVPDPVRRGDDGSFESALGQIERRVADLAPRLTPLAPTP
jgi:protein-tyrosine-phosphatase/DNA-binding HxlR family transcriptional regulator